MIASSKKIFNKVMALYMEYNSGKEYWESNDSLTILQCANVRAALIFLICWLQPLHELPGQTVYLYFRKKMVKFKEDTSLAQSPVMLVNG